MEEGELIKDFNKRFTVITNQLMLFGRSFDNVDLVHKMLRSLTKMWQPKVTTNKESFKMGISIIQELYGNLEKHELKLKRCKRNGDEKKKRSLALKASGSCDDEDYEFYGIERKDDEYEMGLLNKKLQTI